MFMISRAEYERAPSRKQFPTLWISLTFLSPGGNNLMQILKGKEFFEDSHIWKYTVEKSQANLVSRGKQIDSNFKRKGNFWGFSHLKIYSGEKSSKSCPQGETIWCKFLKESKMLNNSTQKNFSKSQQE